MTDGKNQARALRILEIINDYRTIQSHITAYQGRYQIPPGATEMGYVVFQRCVASARRLSSIPFNPGDVSLPGQSESDKSRLQAIVLDASVRRFMAYDSYLKISAAVRWRMARDQILRGQPQSPAKAPQLKQVDERLREEVAAVTSQHVYDELRNKDNRQAYWIDEDPSLARLEKAVSQFLSDATITAAAFKEAETE